MGVEWRIFTQCKVPDTPISLYVQLHSSCVSVLKGLSTYQVVNYYFDPRSRWILVCRWFEDNLHIQCYGCAREIKE